MLAWTQQNPSEDLRNPANLPWTFSEEIWGRDDEHLRGT
jgi:hypothetical protein